VRHNRGSGFAANGAPPGRGNAPSVVAPREEDIPTVDLSTNGWD
jgi:hypothetical protein